MTETALKKTPPHKKVPPEVRLLGDKARTLFKNEQAEAALALVESGLGDYDHHRLKRLKARLLMFMGDEAGAAQILKDIIPDIWQPGFWELAMAGSQYGYCVTAPKQKLMYFPVRKCGCTSLYNMMNVLNGGAAAGEDIHSQQQHTLIRFDELQAKKPDWHKLLVVRDPIARVRSYYHGNIIGRDHLVLDTGGKDTFYGLPTKPDVKTFMAHFKAYRRTFIVVRNHTDPLVAFAGHDPEVFDIITSLGQLPETLVKLSKVLDAPLNLSHDMRTQKRLTDGESDWERYGKILRQFYADDYRLFGAFLKKD